jgi:hypothetical protein
MTRTRLGVAIALAVLSGAGAAFADPAALAKAIRQGSEKSASALIAAGSGINQADDKGRAPLHYACVRGDAALIGALLDKGADANAADPEGETPLILLARDSFDISGPVQALIAHGARVNVQDKAGRTALMEAILRAPGVLDFQAETRLVKILLDAGADTSLRDDEGFLAAHHAAAVGQPVSMFKAVLASTAHPDAVNGEGLDVLLVAVQANHPVIARQMFQAGYAPRFAPPATPAGIAQDPTRLDDHASVNATALAWYAEFLAQQGKAAEATATWRGALTALDAAIREDDRVTDAVRKVLAEDERKREAGRAANFAINVAGVALAAATGTGGILLTTPNAQVEQDRQRLATLAADEARLVDRRDALRQKLELAP